MTRTTNARIAGFTFLVYIAAGITSMVLFTRASRGEAVAAQLASIAQHATDLRVTDPLVPGLSADPVPVTELADGEQVALVVGDESYLLVHG